MIRTITFILALFLSFSLSASHIVGGEVYYDTIGQDGNGNMTYEVTIELFRDCDQFTPFPGNGTGQWATLHFTIFDENDQVYDTYTAPYNGSNELPLVYDDPCVEPPDDICIESAIYVTQVTIPISAGDYTISYQVGWWAGSYVNFIDPANIGMTLTCSIPGTDKIGTNFNNSPRYTEYPQIVFCLNQQLSIPANIFEEDGDSLAFKLCDPLLLPNPTGLHPDPEDAPPYQPIPWETGYNANFPFGTGSPTSMDVNTGVFTTTPTMLGNYVARFCVEEWRDGELLNTHSRTFGYTIVECDVEPAFEINVVGGGDIIEGCGGVEFVIERNDTVGNLALGFISSGDGVNGVNFGPIPDSVYIPAGTQVDTLQVNTIFNGPAEGDLETTVSITYLNPCTGEVDTASTSFTILDYFPMEVTILDSLNLCSEFGEQIPVVAQVEGGIEPYFYQWNNNFVQYPSTDSVVIDASLLEDNFNPFYLTVFDACGYEAESDFLLLYNRCPLVAPNVITANNDGTNDFFIVKNLEQYDRVSLQIYNRWGEIVFETEDYNNLWSGKDNNGNDLIEGVYFYSVIPESDKFEYREDGILNRIHGYVHVVRDN
jgi:gliding motility-associated-like protein